MSEAKFTKGEWKVTKVQERLFKVDSECGDIAKTIRWNGSESHKYNDEVEANANLIAAAPNLYHALKRTTEELAFVIDRYNKKVKDPTNFIDAETCHLNQIELAKARGEKC